MYRKRPSFNTRDSVGKKCFKGKTLMSCRTTGEIKLCHVHLIWLHLWEKFPFKWQSSFLTRVYKNLKLRSYPSQFNINRANSISAIKRKCKNNCLILYACVLFYYFFSQEYKVICNHQSFQRIRNRFLSSMTFNPKVFIKKYVNFRTRLNTMNHVHRQTSFFLA